MDWSTHDWTLHIKEEMTQWYVVFRLDRYGGSLQITDGMGKMPPRAVVARLKPKIAEVLKQGMGLLERY